MFVLKTFKFYCNYNFIKKLAKREKEDDTFLKKTDDKENGATIMISVDKKGTVFPVKLKL